MTNKIYIDDRDNPTIINRYWIDNGKLTPKKLITEELKYEVRKLREKGLSMENIAKVVQIGANTVSLILRGYYDAEKRL